MGAASIVVGDNPGLSGYGANEECFRKTGLMEAAKGYYQNIGNDSRKVAFNAISCPKLVSPGLCWMPTSSSACRSSRRTVNRYHRAIKNSFGLLPGAQKSQAATRRRVLPSVPEMLVDVFGLRVPDLFHRGCCCR